MDDYDCYSACRHSRLLLVLNCFCHSLDNNPGMGKDRFPSYELWYLFLRQLYISFINKKISWKVSLSKLVWIRRLYFFSIKNPDVWNKLKSLKVAKWRRDEWRVMKDEWRMMKDEGWMMQYDDFKLLRGFDLWRTDRRTNERTDICDCRVAFATEKQVWPVSNR